MNFEKYHQQLRDSDFLQRHLNYTKSVSILKVDDSLDKKIKYSQMWADYFFYIGKLDRCFIDIKCGAGHMAELIKNKYCE